MKLWLVKVGTLDACIRPLFANSVTYMHICMLAQPIANIHQKFHFTLSPLQVYLTLLISVAMCIWKVFLNILTNSKKKLKKIKN